MKQLMLIKSVIVFLLISSFSSVQAAELSQEIPYYGSDFYSDLRGGIANEDLIYRIKQVLRSFHVSQNNQSDLIVTSCLDQKGRCYAHKAIGYNAARVFLLGNYYLVKKGSNYAVRDFYCDTDRDTTEFREHAPAPDAIPDNTVVNVEHTWPQSRFNRRFPEDIQKSDLHHLFPTDSQLNAIRGNYIFGEVANDTTSLKCVSSRFGIGTGGRQKVFEPPKNHKGHVARALFYFSVRYDLNISSHEEAILRKWHNEHPVDEDEFHRNEAIYGIQGNRNPFVDHPELVDRISNF